MLYICLFNSFCAFVMQPQYRMKSYVVIPLSEKDPEKSPFKLVLLTTFNYAYVCFEVAGVGSARQIFDFPVNKLRVNDVC